MQVDRARFFTIIRSRLFRGKLGTEQVRGIETVLDEYEKRAGDADPRHLAYMLATAYHETAATMQPVRETLAASDEAAIRILDRALEAGRLGQVRTPYWRRDADGKSWLGRGLVQLTHRRNYEAMSAVVGVDLVQSPEMAVEPRISAAILVEGMLRGGFTGRKLSHYFDRIRGDWEGARAIINGRDRAELIAGYGRVFHEAVLSASGDENLKMA